jgi:beta-1,4-mannosyl-glycoprotein beta-1,4-N-acetylglucosaminyltransferase
VDEIPRLNDIKLEKIKNKIIIFKKTSHYYKLDWELESLVWHGTKACKKKHLKSPQWLRNIKNKRYHPIIRPDTLFKRNRYYDIYFAENGGWHFSSVKTPEKIFHKLKNFLHHNEPRYLNMQPKRIEECIERKQVHFVDLSFGDCANADKTLRACSMSRLPLYIQDNKDKFHYLIGN